MCRFHVVLVVTLTQSRKTTRRSENERGNEFNICASRSRQAIIARRGIGLKHSRQRATVTSQCLSRTRIYDGTDCCSGGWTPRPEIKSHRTNPRRIDLRRRDTTKYMRLQLRCTYIRVHSLLTNINDSADAFVERVKSAKNIARE